MSQKKSGKKQLPKGIPSLCPLEDESTESQYYQGYLPTGLEDRSSSPSDYSNAMNMQNTNIINYQRDHLSTLSSVVSLPYESLRFLPHAPIPLIGSNLERQLYYSTSTMEGASSSSGERSRALRNHPLMFSQESVSRPDDYLCDRYGLETKSHANEPLDLGMRKNRETETDTYPRHFEDERGNQPRSPMELSDDPQPEKPLKKKKEPKCSLCANHDVFVPMKGHKHYCPRSECTCTSCNITRNRQHYMKLQQQNTRRKHQEKEKQVERRAPLLQEERSSDALQDTMATYEYPEHRLLQMKKDLGEDPTDFLKEVDKICKPKKNF